MLTFLLFLQVTAAPPPSECRAREGDIVAANLASSDVWLFDGVSGAFRCVFVEAGALGLELAIGIAFNASGDLLASSSGTIEVLRFNG